MSRWYRPWLLKTSEEGKECSNGENGKVVEKSVQAKQRSKQSDLLSVSPRSTHPLYRQRDGQKVLNSIPFAIDDPTLPALGALLVL